MSLRGICVLLGAGAASALQVAAPPIEAPWTIGSGSVSPSTKLPKLFVAIKEQNGAEVEKIALAASDPTSDSYGNHLSVEELAALTAPAAADAQKVRGWLAASDCRVLSESTDRLLTVDCSVGAAEKLLATTFRQLVHSASGQRLLRATEYTVPTELESAISSVFGLHGMPLPPRARRATPLTPPKPWGADVVAPPQRPAEPANVTPAVIAQVYNVEGVTVDRSSKNKMAVAEFQGQTMNETDLQTYFDMFVPDAKPGDDSIDRFIGDPGNGASADEASLDIQFIMGVAPGIKTDFYLYNSMDFCKDLKNWTSHMLADPVTNPHPETQAVDAAAERVFAAGGCQDAALVHSVSYGIQANLTAEGKQMGCSKDNLDAVDADFAKLAARGLSIIFASGDSGSGYAPAFCEKGLQKDTQLTGTVSKAKCEGRPCPNETTSAADCCQISSAAKVRQPRKPTRNTTATS